MEKSGLLGRMALLKKSIRERYLGNAMLREESVFGDYSYIRGTLVEEGSGLTVDQRRETAIEEAQRIKDTLHLRGEFMDENISKFQQFAVYRTNSSINTIIATLLILAFIISTVLVRRYRQIR